MPSIHSTKIACPADIPGVDFRLPKVECRDSPTAFDPDSSPHGLSAYRLAAPWWLAVAVSAVAPAVLRAIVHLAVLTSRTRTDDPERDVEPSNDPARHDETPDADPVTELIESGAGRRRLARELDISEHQARQLLAERNGAAQ